MTIDNNATMTTTSCSEKDNNALLNGTKESLLALSAQREALEVEASAIASELESPGPNGQPPMGINTPLVDADGYPRNDIDLYRAKALRGRLAVIKTDLAALLKDTERHLLQLGTLQKSPERVEADKNEYAARLQPKPKPKYDPVTGKWVVKNWDGSFSGAGKDGQGRSFDTLAATSASTQVAAIRQLSGISNQNTMATTTIMSRTPFSRVNQVAPSSPAHEAGLLENDLILQFGNISLNNDNTTTTTLTDDPMTRVAALVPQAAAQGRAIEITVLRRGSTTNGGNMLQGGGGTDTAAGTIVSLSLTPRPWSGRGMIGCHIVPYQAAPTTFAFSTSS